MGCGDGGVARLRWGLLAILLGAGCAEREVILWSAPPPAVAGTESMVISAAFDERVEVRAVDTPGGALPTTVEWPIEMFDGDPSDVELRVHAYPLPLEGLDLSEGPVERESGRRCVLESPLAVHATRIGEPDWQEQSILLEPELVYVLFDNQPCARPDLCRSFSTRRVELDSPSDALAAAPLTETSVLVSTKSGWMYEVDRDQAVRRRDLEHLPFTAIHRVDDGTYWFGGVGGRISHGLVDGPQDMWTVGTSTFAVVAALAPSPTGDEVLAVLLQRIKDVEEGWVEVYRLREGVWDRIYDQVVRDGGIQEGEVQWLDESRAVLSYGGPVLMRYEAGQIDVTDLRTFDIVDHIAGALLPRPDGGIYIGARFGFLFRSMPPFVEIERLATPIPNTIQALAHFGDGVLVSGTNGYLGQFHPGGIPCDGMQYHWDDGHELIVLGEDIFQIGNNPPRATQKNVVTVLNVLDP